MTRETAYIVQAFVAGRGTGLKAEKAVPCKSGEAARRMAERMAASKLGVVAFSTAGDPETGDYDEQPTILFKAGRLSPQFED
ncbi:MAG: hypothetical protein WDN01_07430 [Rhizomicrobium sp.]